jgi:hypothetical protein
VLYTVGWGVRTSCLFTFLFLTFLAFFFCRFACLLVFLLLLGALDRLPLRLVGTHADELAAGDEVVLEGTMATGTEVVLLGMAKDELEAP